MKRAIVFAGLFAMFVLILFAPWCAFACVTPEQYGAVRDDGLSDAMAIQRAVDNCVDSCVQFSDGQYDMGGTTLEINKCAVRLVGNNAGLRDYATYLKWSAGVTGVRVSGNGKWSRSEGVAYMGRRSPDVPNRNAHGIEMLTNFDLDRTHVANFDGYGVRAQCALGNTNNCNTFVIGSLWAESNGLAGVYFNGKDANAFDVGFLSLVENAGGGLIDDSFLGGSVRNIHYDGGPYSANVFAVSISDANNTTKIDYMYMEGAQSPIKLAAHSTIDGGNWNFRRTQGYGSFRAAGVQWGSQGFLNTLDKARITRLQLAQSSHLPSCFFEAAVENADEVQQGQPLRLCNEAGSGTFNMGGLEIGDGSQADLATGQVAFPQGLRLGAKGNRRKIFYTSTPPTTACRGGDLLLNTDAKGASGCWAWFCVDDTRTWRCAKF